MCIIAIVVVLALINGWIYMSEKRVWRFLILVCVVFLFASFMLSSLLLPVKADAQVTIVNHGSYLDIGNYYHVVGEVQNTGDVPVKDVYITVTFYDAFQHILESHDEQILLEVLLVGRKAPFMFVVSEENSMLVGSYDISVSDFDSTSAIPLGLEILSYNHVVTGYIIRIMTITGQIKNVGTLTANAVRVVATFYSGPSGTGDVVGASLGPSVPVILPSGQEGTFTIVQDVSGREQAFVSYILTAESLEYAIVPEFPASMILAIFMMITLVAVAVARKRAV